MRSDSRRRLGNLRTAGRSTKHSFTLKLQKSRPISTTAMTDEVVNGPRNGVEPEAEVAAQSHERQEGL